MASTVDKNEIKEDSHKSEISDKKETCVYNNNEKKTSPKAVNGLEKANLERRVPRVNCKERIVFIVDLCKEENSTLFHLSEGSSYTYLYIIKRVLALFLFNKKAINPLHTFSLVILQETPVWVVDFTSNPKDILNELESLEEISSSSSSFDLSELFGLIKSRITLPSESSDLTVTPPPYIIRAIFIYGRSLCVPQFLNGKESYSELMTSPYFFLDILYVHEPPDDSTKCEGIFDLLCDLDSTGWNYILEVGRNATKLHNLGSILLAHPLQRPSQKDAHHTLATKEAAS
ncbi:UNVERIFIED_CONTAM: hypothetical protein RMT77_002503 [Armadillidium vulgare]|nr:BRISC and BRCA1-A complex member 1 [Armadillidium vulgare]